jgi:hypothetical protein
MAQLEGGGVDNTPLWIDEGFWRDEELWRDEFEGACGDCASDGGFFCEIGEMRGAIFHFLRES